METQPCLIVEILSDSTRAIDETFKATDYRRIEGLQGYLLVDSQKRGVVFHRRTPDGWQLEQVESSVELPCIGATLTLDDVYRNVTFEY